MFLKLLRLMVNAAKGDTGRKCPACGGVNTEDLGPFWLCYTCDYEW